MILIFEYLPLLNDTMPYVWLNIDFFLIGLYNSFTQASKERPQTFFSEQQFFWNKNDQHFALKERSTPRHMDKVVYISLEYINMHLLYIMRVLIFMDPDKGCKRSFIWGRKGCAWETNAKNKKLSKLTYLTLLQY